MRKVTTTLFVILVSVLNIWGQTTGFTYDDVIKEISDLKNRQSDVITQINDLSRLSDSDKQKAPETLDSTFVKLDRVISVYKRIEQDPELKDEANNLVKNFLEDYRKAILDVNMQNVDIKSRKVIDVAESYTGKFDEFYEKAQIYIKSHSNGADEKGGGYQQTDIGNSDGDGIDIVVDDEERVEQREKFDLTSVLSLSALILGLISLGIGLMALIRVSYAHKRISIRKRELEEVEKRLNKVITELSSSSYRGTPSSYLSPRSSAPQRSLQSVQNPPVRHGESYVEQRDMAQDSRRANPQNDVRKQSTYLYATVKAQSHYAEFFKVSNEKSDDKVFMLTLGDPNAEVAEFTIVPDMQPDFMKSVIINRDTYLSSLFCEKTIVSSNPTRIDVESPGRAKKVDGKWQVQERMTIRLV